MTRVSLNERIKGFVKIWQVDPKTGASTLLVDQPNLILRSGASVLSYALAGRENSGIWGFYIGFNNNMSFTYPTIDVGYSQPFQTLPVIDGFGYLREPLTFEPTYLSDSNYEDNTVLFSVMLSSSSSMNATPFISGTSNIYEIAMISAPDPTTSSSDIVFSRTNFNQITYDSNFNLNITWGVKSIVE